MDINTLFCPEMLGEISGLFQLDTSIEKSGYLVGEMAILIHNAHGTSCSTNHVGRSLMSMNIE